MKKAFFIILFLCCLSGYSVRAQDTLQTTTTELAQAILNKMDHEVMLSEQQKKEVMALLLERSENIKKLKAGIKEEKLTKDYLAQVNEQSYNKLKKVLSEEQYSLLQELRKETKKQKEKYSAAQVYQSEQDVELDF